MRSPVRLLGAGFGLLAVVLCLGGAESAFAALPRFDVTVTVASDFQRIEPGGRMSAEIRALAPHKRGTVRQFSLVARLPAGLAFVPSWLPSYSHCSLSHDRRTVRCASVPAGGSQDMSGGQFGIDVAPDFPDGTRPRIAATVLLHDAVDPHPLDNSASDDVLVKAGPKIGVRWIAPSRVPAGTSFTTRLVVTNEGHETATLTRVRVGLEQAADLRPDPRIEADCFIGDEEPVIECADRAPLQPGRSLVWTIRWNAPSVATEQVRVLPAAAYADYSPRSQDVLVVTVEP